jgi:hypothetical protein
MSILSTRAPSRWADFLSIPDDATFTGTGEDTDLFVGKNQSVILTLSNDATRRFRDVVVLGELTIQSSDPTNTAIKPRIIARDVFKPGALSLNNVSVHFRNYSSTNTEVFHRELQQCFLDWLSIQRESAQELGLRSILV